MTRFSDDAIAAVKARNSCIDLAQTRVMLRRRRSAAKFPAVGPCPVCSENPASRTDGRFECSDESWVCAACAAGGDAIALCMRIEGIGFEAAILRLGGEHHRDAAVTAATASRKGRDAFRAGASPDANPYPPGALRASWQRGFAAARAADAASERYREEERRRLYELLCAGTRWPGTPVERYFACRGLRAPESARLRYNPATPLFGEQWRDGSPVLIWRGPAMLAPVFGADGKFRGLHCTFLDPALAGLPLPAGARTGKGKLFVFDPTTGAQAPAKKLRGLKQGGYIDLGGEPQDDPVPYPRMVAGEGIETALAVYTACAIAGRGNTGTLYRAACDLGNLGGRALSSVAHPSWKDKAGRARRVPGPDADFGSPVMPVPDSVCDLVLLGDGDSDPAVTGHALARALARHARPGRSVRVAMADAGGDFNDMIMPNRAAGGQEFRA